jgi:hypothetical protein
VSFDLVDLGNRSVWITSFWGFDPGLWGGVGFTEEYARAAYLHAAPPGSLLAIYVTKHRGPEEMRGKVVGMLEINSHTASMQSLTSPTEWAASQREAGTKNKWAFGVQASRAWKIAPEEWQDVNTLLPKTYASNNAQLVGSKGVPVEPSEVSNLLSLTAIEVPVYRQPIQITDQIGSIAALALRTSRAIHPGTEPRLVGEIDGPKFIYILRLEGNIAHYLGRDEAAVDGRSIIKVGFSKSPRLRASQLQSAYPAGAFKWEVLHPFPTPDAPMFEDARAAIVGEDAMKARLTEEGAEVLGGEFFLADDGMIVRAWNAGRFSRR